MSPRLKKDLTESMNQIVETGVVANRLPKKSSKRGKGITKTTPKVKMEIKTSPKPKTKRKLGRKKVDKKVLQEKMDKLKMTVKTINKITAR